MKEFYKDLHLTYLKGKTSNLKLFKWEVSEKSWIFHEVKEKLLTSHLFQEANHASCWFTNSWITLASPENSPIIIFGPYQVSCLNPLPPSLFVRQDTRAKDHHNSFFPETDDCILWLSLKGFKENRCKLLFWWKWVLNTAML